MEPDNPYRPSRFGLAVLCPGSVLQSAGLPGVDSEEAAEGRLLHLAVKSGSTAGLSDEQTAMVEHCRKFADSKLKEVFDA